MGGITDSQHVVKQLKSVFGGRGLQSRNFVFNLSSKFTPTMLLILTGLIYFQRFSNEHIKCLSPPEEDIRSSAVNEYCFVTGTYTVTNYSSKLKHVGKKLPYPGVGPSVSASSWSSSKGDGTQLKFHLYFQWVPYILAIQAALFYLPGFVCQLLQKRQLASYCEPISNRSCVNLDKGADGKDEFEDDSIRSVAYRFIMNKSYHKGFSLGYFWCEIFNIFAVVAACVLSNLLLDGQFTNFGSDWLHYVFGSGSKDSGYSKFTIFNDDNPSDKVFPKMSKCEFKKFGPGGSIQNHDILCVMTLNVIHEKAFLVLWFWFWLIFLMQIFVFIYRLILMNVKFLRGKMILDRVEFKLIKLSNSNGNNDRYSRDSKKQVREFLSSLVYSDWFMIKRIADNTDRFKFTHFLQTILEFENKSDPHLENSDEINYSGRNTLSRDSRRPNPSEMNNEVINHEETRPLAASSRHQSMSMASQSKINESSLYAPLNQSLSEIRENQDQDTLLMLDENANRNINQNPYRRASISKPGGSFQRGSAKRDFFKNEHGHDNSDLL